MAGRKGGARRYLHPAFGVDIDAGFFGIGRARQDHVGAVRPAVAMGPEIDHEGARRDLDLVGAEQEHDVEPAGRGHPGGREAALAWHETDVEPAPQVFREGRLNCVTGLGKYKGRLIVLLDMAKLLEYSGPNQAFADVEEQQPATNARSAAAK